MSADGRTPTTTSHPGGISGEDYAEDVDAEAQFLARRVVRALDATGTDALTLTSQAGDAPLLALVEGMHLSFVAPANNTGAMTAAIDGLAPVAIVDLDGAALTADRVVSGRPMLGRVHSDGKLRLLTLAPSAAAPKVAIIANKRTNAYGGGLTSGSDQTLSLNTVLLDQIGITGTLPDFIVPAGTYDIDLSAVVEVVQGAQLRLYNVTDAADVSGVYGVSNRINAANNSIEISLKGRFTLSVAKTLRIVARVSATNATDGQGGVQEAGGYFTTADLIYARMILSEARSHIAGPAGPGLGGGTPLPPEDGGTGADNGPDARRLLGLLGDNAMANLGLSIVTGSNTLVCALKQADGATDPDADFPVVVSMPTGTGGFLERIVSSALSLTISNGSTLGHVSGIASVLYWYLIDNAGTLELAVSYAYFGKSGIVSTTAEGGAGGADDGTKMYSATARSNKPFRLIGLSIDTQAAAGTWATDPSQVIVGSVDRQKAQFAANKNAVNQTGIVSATVTKLTFTTEDSDAGGYYDAANSRWYPPPGPVLITAAFLVTANVVDQKECNCIIRKNGVDFKQSGQVSSGTVVAAANVTFSIESTGSDYYEAFAYVDGAGNKTVSGNALQTFFSGVLL